MKILIVGAGEVGYHLARRLSQERHDVVVIEQKGDRSRHVLEHLDVQVVTGSGASPEVLRRARVAEAEMMVACTNSDEINVVACLIAACQDPGLTKVARIRDPELRDVITVMGQDFLKVDYVINPESEVVHIIERLIDIPGATDLAEFARGKVVVAGFRVPEGSPLVGYPLKELWSSGITKDRLLIVALYRGRQVVIPRGDDEIRPGEVVLVVHRADRLAEVYPILGLQPQEVTLVVIAGASPIGVELARCLEHKKGLTVKLIDDRREVCERLSGELRNTLILHGDPADQDLLEQENVGEANVFVAAVPEDDHNILASLLARNLGANRVITLLNRITYANLMHAVGIQVAICPKMVAVSQILQFIRQGRVLSVAAFRDDRAEALEVLAEAESDLVHRPLQDLRLPRGVMVGALIRRMREEVVIPDGATEILPGDHAVFFCTREALPELERLVAKKARA